MMKNEETNAKVQPVKQNLCESTDIAKKNGKEKIKTMARKKGFTDAHLQGTDFRKDISTENADVIEAYNKMKAGGQEERDAYAILLWNKLENLVKYHIGMYHFTYGGTEPDDLIAAGKEGVFAKLDAYDPYYTLPSTFFGPKIDEMLKKTNHSGSIMSDHYIEQLGKMNKAAQEQGYADALDTDLTPEKLSILTDIPITTVINTLEQARKHVDSIDDPNYKEPTVYTSSPEEMYLAKENSAYLCEAVESLSPYEKFIFFKNRVEKEPWSVHRLCRELAKPEVMLRFGLTKAPDSNRVSQDIEIARKKLLHYGNLRQRFHYKSKERKALEAAGITFLFDDIESAINSKIIAL